MIDWQLQPGRTGLLVSVRDAAEAKTALAAGADVIDVKEPSLGSLGAADESVIASVVRAVEGRAPVTAALGELADLLRHQPGKSLVIPQGVSLFKIGLAGCGSMPDWVARWRDAIAAVAVNHDASAPKPVAVVYADWKAANAPSPDDVLRASSELPCPVLLADTWDKSAGALFDHWAIENVRAFVENVRAANIRIVLAGSLAGERFVQAVALRPDLVAVRSAACASGRTSQVSTNRVRELKETIDAFASECPLSAG